jgi:hypothetical protein
LEIPATDRSLSFVGKCAWRALLIALYLLPAQAATIMPPISGISDFKEHYLFTNCLDCGPDGEAENIAPGGTDTWIFTIVNGSKSNWDDFELYLIGPDDLRFVVPFQVTAGFGAPPPRNGIINPADPGFGIFIAQVLNGPVVPPGGQISFKITVENTSSDVTPTYLGLQASLAPEPGSALLVIIGSLPIWVRCLRKRKRAA